MTFDVAERTCVCVAWLRGSDANRKYATIPLSIEIGSAQFRTNCLTLDIRITNYSLSASFIELTNVQRYTKISCVIQKTRIYFIISSFFRIFAQLL